MSSDIFESSAGLSRSNEPPADLPRHPPRPEDSHSDLPAVGSSPEPGGTGSSSVDELALALDHVSPDPYLEEFKPESTPEAALGVHGAGPEPRVAWALDNLDIDLPPSAEITAVAGLPSDPSSEAPRQGPTTATSPPSSTAERFAALDLKAPPASKGVADPPGNKEAANDAEDNDLEDDDDKTQSAYRSVWMALLASYSSAVTLGLIWVLWGHRVTRENAPVEPDPFSAAETTADPGHRAGQSRKFVAEDPLSPERIIGLGQTLVIDSLEVTPLEVSAGRVILRRELNQFEARRGGDGALVLKLRLKNLSSDSTLVPLDEAFIRERKRGIRDSFIATGESERIDMFPLAIVSEWSIAGQEFRELNPGESYETVVVSIPGALDRLTSEMTWHIRLRTDVNQTARMGIRFHNDDIRKRLSPEMPDVREPPEQPTPGDSSDGGSASP